MFALPVRLRLVGGQAGGTAQTHSVGQLASRQAEIIQHDNNVVAAQSPEERDQAIDTKPAVLANWEVVPSGID